MLQRQQHHYPHPWPRFGWSEDFRKLCTLLDSQIGLRNEGGEERHVCRWT